MGEKIMSSTQWYADFQVSVDETIASRPGVEIGIDFCASTSQLLMKGQRSAFPLLDSTKDSYPRAQTLRQENGSFLLHGRGFIFSSASDVTPYGNEFVIQTITVSSDTQERKFVLGRDFTIDFYPKLVYFTNGQGLLDARFENQQSGELSLGELPKLQISAVTIYHV